MENLNYKKYFIITLIVALSISALIGIIIFLFGDFGEIEIQLLLTTLSIGGYSLTGLCSYIIYNRKDLKAFSIYGMLISINGFISTIMAIWEIFDFENLWKTIAILNNPDRWNCSCVIIAANKNKHRKSKTINDCDNFPYFCYLPNANLFDNK